MTKTSAVLPTTPPSSSDTMDVDVATTANRSPHSSDAATTTSIPMSFPLEATTSKEAEQVVSLLHEDLKPLLQHHTETIRRLREEKERISLYYQSKLSAVLTQKHDETERHEQQLQNTKENSNKNHELKIEQMSTELSTLRQQLDSLSSLRDENESLRERLVQRDRQIAQDAEQLAKLIPEANDARSLRVRVSEMEALEDRLRHEESRRVTLDEAHTQAINALHVQLAQLTNDLSGSRAETNGLQATHDKLQGEMDRMKEDMENKEMKYREDRMKTQMKLEALTKELNDTRTAAEQLDTSFKTEVEHLEKMCELHESRAKEAEARATDCEQALEQEREIADRRAKKLQLIRTSSTVGGIGLATTDLVVDGRENENQGEQNPTALANGADLAPHVHALLQDMEKALETRWKLLEKQKSEVERARSVEMRVVADMERLERELKESRTKADASRRDALRYSEQVDRQAQEITRLQKLLSTANAQKQQQQQQFENYNLATSMFPSPSPSAQPFSTPMRMSTGLVPIPPHSAPAMRRSSAVGGAVASPMDIGPKSVIPADYFASPSQMAAGVNVSQIPAQQMSAEFASSLREMSEIRRRHERVLDAMRENRLSFG